MKNFVKSGDVLDLAAPYARTSGQGALIGSVFGISLNTLASGITGPFKLGGVFDITKSATVTPAQGGLAYWDDSAKSVTTSASSTTKIGVFELAALAGDATCRVRLNGAF